ncbi:putative oxidoreductase YxbG [Podospora conica]|nr:putative oxidoreductase YxbG [Schizothecium conicum]
MSKASRSVLAIIGSGGMGLASARRLAGGKHVLIGDYSQKNLDFAAQSLRDDGHEVDTRIVDVANFDSVRQFAEAAAAAGRLETVVHTAGLSPAMAPAKRILDVDLVGTVNIIDAFEPLMPTGSSLTCIASIARFGATPSAELTQHLAVAPRAQLLDNEELQAAAATPAGAYAVAKAGNLLRVQAAARAWGARGARINSISPGVILTAMVRQELESPSGATITGMIAGSPMGRGGAANEIAGAVAFLAGPDASFVTGSDLVVDGGFIAGMVGMGGMAALAGGK